MKIKIKMRARALGSEDGYTSQEFAAGKTYDVGADLAATFINSKLAHPVKPRAAADGEAGA
ncbi:hypothetical protein [Pikeienuella sp. HZG-20]|uniref:hypothetical protein n=1 Tax=Paludibacillus litoralis TaxID=3133267 RepID=UPI0030EF2786